MNDAVTAELVHYLQDMAHGGWTSIPPQQLASMSDDEYKTWYETYMKRLEKATVWNNEPDQRR